MHLNYTKELLHPTSNVEPRRTGRKFAAIEYAAQFCYHIQSVVEPADSFIVSQSIDTYPFETSTTKYLLIDTPGFNDTWLTERDVLDELASWLSSSYKSGLRLNGAIYLHRIQDTRMEGSALRSLRVFKRLCRDNFMKNVILGTTFWDLVSDEVGQAREDELCGTENFFKDMMGYGVRSGANFE
ncbi:hypothetical protein GP486_003812 [Trichoglossum hirsutum]|uniref:G domain-containing protein n=1 Tax=Trichoglossum hirsutum TaxID=265104 RepID=A0A9P8LCJ7_9PEZI|nr:hypothetical protein GP486_003812 [Trichoglossum hirsutum]